MDFTQEDLHNIKLILNVASVYGLADEKRVKEIVEKIEEMEDYDETSKEIECSNEKTSDVQ
ncbi:hypothetical protein [Candidatus Stoquefichus sp. SB1]|uniref:hypothetical protein n=1 Tax=Candidatus Stoquefichus sp. SB1 TaxID=1658109 RepID=UPI00067F0969|nr:hypothetical protein [Candidatus Stoquefichus sp. SB1]